MESVQLSKEEQSYLGMLPENMGLENISLRDINVSILRIIENNSPQRKRNKPQYMPDAEEGDIYDIALKTLHKDFFFLPLKHVKRWGEWIPRKQGGGLVRWHRTPQQVDSDFLLPNGNEQTEASHFLGWMLHGDGTRHFCIIPMERTRLRDARNFLTLIFSERDARGNPLPMGFRIFRITTGPRKRGENDYFGWEVERTKGTIISWAKKNGHDIAKVAREAEEINRTGESFFELGNEPPKEKTVRASISSGEPKADYDDSEFEEDEPF